ncbi:MAG: threonylcarbamoyl-AMP synthase [bacterium (Candidatus Ratteibacteria) CG15_BIG_FIL_POST_REV_8_21_14_020_41_12]|uniref:L-threonylcarbamoyladenylate synthase n=2 Tax=Candidatus Ratteibacteria TaxID=2979319 RepID=A0A2M7GXN1_9BACT|nr:MAG: threonylcarbamoyl-AMP synthase [bacterium (Candidatus Ratteibacteria) CG15_BIG_FIL_POST_REV_8_21_14_020_41_12]
MKVTKINPLNPEKEKLKEAASILKKGGVLIFPTDTVYGIGTSYKNEAGLKKIFALKQRPEIKPLAILVESKKMALGIVESNKKIEKEVEKVWPGAVTLLLKAKIPLSPFLRDSSSKVGLRVPDYPLLLKLLKISGPLAATSANISGQPADCQIETIEKKILKGADLIIDGGKTSGKESSVWDFTGEPAKLIRGEILFVCTGNSCRSPMAAGLMKKMLEEKGNKNIRVDSAGFLFSARGATKEAIEVMKGEGIDLLNHRSKLATPFLVKNFDLILVMGEIHKERILKMFHQAAERVFVLDIPDPIGKPLTFYEQTLKTIKEKIKEIVLPKIV